MPPRQFDPVSYLEWNAARRGSAVAIWEHGVEITFEQLLGHVRGVQRALTSRGVRSGDVVGVRLPNVWQYVVLELAIPDMGAVIAPLPLALGEYEVRGVLERTRPALVVTSDEVGDLTRPSDGRAPAPERAVPDPERIVEIALSSGTTGMPKLASLSARLKQATFESFTQRLEVTGSDRVLPMTPLTQGIGGMCLYCLRLGASLVMLSHPHWTVEHCLATAVDSHATLMVGVPTNVIRMLSHAHLDAKSLPAVRAVAVAGAPLPPEVAERWETSNGIPISSFYGSMDAGQLAVASPSDPPATRWTTVGRPHDRAEWTILDSAGQAVDAGEVGEICMRGDLVQQRYWGEEAGPYASDGWAHMGDLGFVDQAGYLHVVGRVKDIIIRGGANINPYEVESMLRTHPSIVDACVVARPDSDLGEVPVAYVVARPGFEPTREKLDPYLVERGLARYKWPEVIRRVDELPLSGPGKVNRKALREDARAS